jgi:hypothetical protein
LKRKKLLYGGIKMKYLGMAIMIVTITFVIKFLCAEIRKEPDTHEEGTFILRMSKGIKVMGYSGIGFAIIVTLVSITATDNLLISAIYMLFFLAPSLLLILLSNVKIEVGEMGIKYFGMTGKTKIARWEKIRKVKFRGQYLVIVTDVTTIMFDIHISGFGYLIEVLKEKTEYEAYKDIAHVLERVKF